MNRQLQRYELLEEVGQGGMAVVYRGLDTSLKREVAVKILHKHLAKDEESKQRFLREAQAVAKLKHDNILEIYDYAGEGSDQSFIVTEFIHGQTLKDFVAHQAISHPEIAVMLVYEICRALSQAHRLSVIHRDIKPENIMIRQDGRVKLTDFGIAQMVDLRKLTVTGQLLGSPAYMSPELVQGAPVDFRSDIFSVGTLLYQLAASEMPFQGKNPHEVLKRIADGQYEPPEAASAMVDGELGGIIRKALAHDPDHRYRRAEDLMGDLAAFLAKVDITDPRAELIRYFEDPQGYGSELQQRIVTTLIGRGRAEIEAGRKAKALRLLDRVLCVDPDNAEVSTTLDRLTRQRRWVHAGLLSFVGGSVALAIYLAVAYWPTGGASPPRHTRGPETLAGSRIGSGAPSSESPRAGVDAAVSKAEAGPQDGGNDGLADGTLARRGRRTAGGRSGHPRSKVGAGAVRAPRRVEIVPRPKAMTIWMNGRKLGSYGPDLRYLTLPGGPVTLAFRNDDCCFERVMTIGSAQRPAKLAVRLPWKPGRVKVLVKPDVGAAVVVGSQVARAGQTVEVPIPVYSQTGRTGVQVTISASGFATESRTVSVRANTTTTFPIALRPLP